MFLKRHNKMEKMKLHIGCGRNILSGYLNVDKIKNPGVDKVMDLNKLPYPFPNNTFDEIYADNILEHLDDLDTIMKELHRIMKKKGLLKIKVPHYSQIGAFSDPTHKRFFTYQTFDFYTGDVPDFDYYYDFKFKMKEKKLTFLYEYKKGIAKIVLFLIYLIPFLVYKISPYTYEWFLKSIFPASEIQCTLQKI